MAVLLEFRTPSNMINTKYGFFGTVCLLSVYFAAHVIFIEKNNHSYMRVDVPIKRIYGANDTVHVRKPGVRLMDATGPLLPIPNSQASRLLISPNETLQTLLLRLDRSAKDALISKMRRVERSTEGKMTETAGEGADQLIEAYEVLRSMGYSSRLPDVINIGVKKGGTTTLMYYLSNHPQIQTSLGAREVHYFDWHYDSGLRWYESRMKIARDDQIVYEKTPRYFVHDPVAERIHRDLGGDLRFLLCVRDPVSRLISDFRFSKVIRSTRDWKRQQTPETEAVRFISTILTENGTVKADNEMVLTSNYAFHFKRWLKYHRRDQFLIIDSSEMINNVSGTLRQIESFLGLRSFYQENMFLKTEKGDSCLRINSRTSCARNIGASILPKPKVSPELEQKLRDYYRPHNKELERLTGRTFDWADI